MHIGIIYRTLTFLYTYFMLVRSSSNLVMLFFLYLFAYIWEWFSLKGISYYLVMLSHDIFDTECKKKKNYNKHWWCYNDTQCHFFTHIRYKLLHNSIKKWFKRYKQLANYWKNDLCKHILPYNRNNDTKLYALNLGLNFIKSNI